MLTAGVAMVVGIIILLLVAKKLWNNWSSQFISSAVRQTYGMANMEDVEDVREQEQTLVLIEDDSETRELQHKTILSKSRQVD